MKKTSNFKIGDRVRLIRLMDKSMEEFINVGETGTVVEVAHTMYRELACMVEFDEFKEEGNYNLEQYFKEVLGQTYHDEVYFETNAIGLLDSELELI